MHERPAVEHSTGKFSNLTLQAKEQIWVDYKLIIAWHQNS